MSLQKETEHIDKQSEQCSQDKKLEEKADRIKETEVATGKNSSNNLPLSKTENTKKNKSAHEKQKFSVFVTFGWHPIVETFASK